MRKYISIFRLVLRCLLVARKENSTGFSTGLTGRSKNLDPTGNPTGRSTRPVPVDPTGFHLWFIVYLLMIPMLSIFTLAIKVDGLFLTIFQSFHLFVSFVFDKLAPPPEYMFQKMFYITISSTPVNKIVSKVLKT